MLCAHARAVAGICRLLHLLEQLTVLFEDRKRLRQVGQLEIRSFEFCENAAAHRLDLLLRNIGFAPRNLTFQAQLARIWNVLRNTQADVGEFAVGVASKRTRAANAEMLQRELRVWERRDLCRNLLCCFEAMPRRFDLRIVLLRFREQLGEWSCRSRVRGCRLLGKSGCTQRNKKQKRRNTSTNNYA